MPLNRPLCLFLSLNAWLAMPVAQAQDRIYRCGNEYTNNVPPARMAECKPVTGGNVTIVQAIRPPAQRASAAPSAASSGPRAENPEQRARDNDARQILEAELRKAETRRAELLKDYNNGEPEKLGPEFRNHQKYLDRVAEMKASIDRSEADIAGIKREIARITPATPASK